MPRIPVPCRYPHLNWLERLIRRLLLRWFRAQRLDHRRHPSARSQIRDHGRLAHHQLGFPGFPRRGPRAGPARSISSASTACSDGRWAASCAPWAGSRSTAARRRTWSARSSPSSTRHDDFILVVAPEGTRSRTTEWKTGFYQIAIRPACRSSAAGPDYPDQARRIRPGHPPDRRLCRRT